MLATKKFYPECDARLLGKPSLAVEPWPSFITLHIGPFSTRKPLHASSNLKQLPPHRHIDQALIQEACLSASRLELQEPHESSDDEPIADVAAQVNSDAQRSAPWIRSTLPKVIPV